MSRAYRIAVTESLNRIVQAEDGVCSRLELLPLLPREELGGLLAAELSRRGFTREGDTLVRIEPDDVRVEVDVTTGEVRVRVADEAEVELHATREVAVAIRDNPTPEQVAEAGEKAKAQVREALEVQAEREGEVLQLNAKINS